MTDTPNPDQAGNAANDPNAQVPAAPQAPQMPPAPPAPPVPPASPVAPPAGQPYPGQPAPVARPTNTLAIVSLVGSFFIGLVGIICGHIALGQIKKRGEGGRGLALAGTIIGYVNTAIWILVIVFSIIAASLAVSATTAGLNSLQEQVEALPEVTDTPEAAPETDSGSTGETGDRSPEFCAIFQETTDVSLDAEADGSMNAATLDLFKRLAETPSPNQAIYERFYAIAQDPSALTDDVDPENLMSDYVEAAMEDGMACM